MKMFQRFKKKPENVPDSKELGVEEPNEHKFPTFPPPPPRFILNGRPSYQEILRARKFGAPKGVKVDEPVYALYRIYENIMMDNTIGLRNELEAFWNKGWPVSEIPDPVDADEPERYAVLSCIPALLVEAFNKRLDLGLRKEGHAIMSMEEAERLAQTPKNYETVPEWTKNVASVDGVLHIPHTETKHKQLESLDDEQASPPFREKNILFWHPHIHFV